MRKIVQKLFKGESGQALIEMAFVLPLLLTVIFNAVNFGYFFIVALNLAVAPRTAALYAVEGYQTLGSPTTGSPPTVPDASPANATGSVAYLAYEDMRGALVSYASASVQVCSKTLGYATGTEGTVNQMASCATCTSSTSGTCSGTNNYTPSVDPEAPSFTLHRVDVRYTFSTLISGTVFNAALPGSLCSGGSCTFHRYVSMRAMD